MNKILNIVLLLYLAVPVTLFGQQIYNTSLSDIQGKTVTVGELKGDKLTVVDFWATWCKPCLLSMPELVKMSAEFDSQGVRFIGINEDGPRNIAKVKPFALSKGITYPVLMDSDQQLMSDMLVSALPTLIILDKDGSVLYMHEGFTYGDENEIKDKLSSLLDEKN